MSEINIKPSDAFRVAHPPKTEKAPITSLAATPNQPSQSAIIPKSTEIYPTVGLGNTRQLSKSQELRTKQADTEADRSINAARAEAKRLKDNDRIFLLFNGCLILKIALIWAFFAISYISVILQFLRPFAYFSITFFSDYLFFYFFFKYKFKHYFKLTFFLAGGYIFLTSAFLPSFALPEANSPLFRALSVLISGPLGIIFTIALVFLCSYFGAILAAKRIGYKIFD